MIKVQCSLTYDMTKTLKKIKKKWGDVKKCWMVEGKAHVAGWLKLRVFVGLFRLAPGDLLPSHLSHVGSLFGIKKCVSLTLAIHHILMGLFNLTPKWTLIGMLLYIAILSLPTIWHARLGQCDL